MEAGIEERPALYLTPRGKEGEGRSEEAGK
jgi:hypothetical protein